MDNKQKSVTAGDLRSSGGLRVSHEAGCTMLIGRTHYLTTSGQTEGRLSSLIRLEKKSSHSVRTAVLCLTAAVVS